MPCGEAQARRADRGSPQAKAGNPQSRPAHASRTISFASSYSCGGQRRVIVHPPIGLSARASARRVEDQPPPSGIVLLCKNTTRAYPTMQASGRPLVPLVRAPSFGNKESKHLWGWLLVLAATHSQYHPLLHLRLRQGKARLFRRGLDALARDVEVFFLALNPNER